MFFPEVVWLFRCFLAKSNVALFAPCGEPYVFALVKSTVDFDSDTPMSWRVFFTWLDVVKGFYFTMERILRSSTTVVLLMSCPFYVAELTSPFFFFFFQNVTNC